MNGVGGTGVLHGLKPLRRFSLPDDILLGYKTSTSVAEKTASAFYMHLEGIPTFGTIGIHVKFVNQGIAVTGFTEKLRPLRG